MLENSSNLPFFHSLEPVQELFYGGSALEVFEQGRYGHSGPGENIRQHKGLRELIEAIPEQDWTPIPYWMDGAADVAETTYTPFQSEPRRCGSSSGG